MKNVPQRREHKCNWSQAHACIIILCTHRSERYEDFVEALDSLDAQSCENEKLEIVEGCRWKQGAV